MERIWTNSLIAATELAPAPVPFTWQTASACRSFILTKILRRKRYLCAIYPIFGRIFLRLNACKHIQQYIYHAVCTARLLASSSASIRVKNYTHELRFIETNSQMKLRPDLTGSQHLRRISNKRNFVCTLDHANFRLREWKDNLKKIEINHSQNLNKKTEIKHRVSFSVACRPQRCEFLYKNPKQIYTSWNV